MDFWQHMMISMLFFKKPQKNDPLSPLDYASLAFRFLFAKNLPPAVFLHAKSPLRVRVPYDSNAQ